MYKLITTLCFIILTHSLIGYDVHLKDGKIATLEVCQESDLKTCESIFIKSFTKAYEDFSPELLGVKDKSAFLKEAFADVYQDVFQGFQILMIAKVNQEIVGFVGFKTTEVQGQIYISQLSVDPKYWQQGLGKHLVFSAFNQYEEIQSLVVIPRKINNIARIFYSKIGFVESSYMHSGYNPERYIGYEWTPKKES